VELISEFFNNFLALSAEASPWLLLGLIIAGLMKSWVPTKILSKHLGSGSSAIFKAAFIGAPLPLCSCGVIPVATELRRSGASAPATSSFLVATPETGVDSVSVSYALLGPIFAIYRPITAIFSAIITGFIVATAAKNVKDGTTSPAPETNQPPNTNKDDNIEKKSCCASKNAESEPVNSASFISKTLTGLHYAATKLIDDLIIWLLIGLLFATCVKTFLAISFLTDYGSGIGAMLIMVLISIPMYICATASTPIAAGFIMAGISPGTALVFMMAGPATNISTLGVIKKEMGLAVLVRYLLGITACSLGFGLLLDWTLTYLAIDITSQMQHSHEMLPLNFGLTCTAIITLLAIKPLRKLIL